MRITGKCIVNPLRMHLHVDFYAEVPASTQRHRVENAARQARYDIFCPPCRPR